MSAVAPLGLFEGYGIEIEYMIVDADSLDVRPICDKLIEAVSGECESEFERGDIAWSNELALHVVEFKTNGPSETLRDLGRSFQANVVVANEALQEFGARLLPTGMHPWMDAKRDFEIWPHEYNAVYRTFDRIFDCAGHGWVNLQSAHLNLPFSSDDEFAKLHAAVRLVLPLVPGLAASTPVVDGAQTGMLDTRLQYYKSNCARVPSVTGVVVPEPVFSIDDYRRYLLPSIYRDLASLDPDGVLRHEWVNARGAIARFDRMALEIRLIDTQECPAADIGIATAIASVVRYLVEEAWCSNRAQRDWDHKALAAMLNDSIRSADTAIVENSKFLQCFGFPERGRVSLGELWQHLLEAVDIEQACSPDSKHALDVIIKQGCLARRIVDASESDDLQAVYRRLADCLAQGSAFES